MQTDVIIVGAGPTGLALASQLVRYGIDHRIIEKRDSTNTESRAIGVQARTLEIYDQIGLADQLVAEGLKANKVQLLAGGEVRGAIDLHDLGEGLSPFPFLLLIEQGTHEKILYEYIKRHGSDVDWQTALERFDQTKDGVTARFARSDGSNETIDARYLVGCDGAHSLVRHSLDIEFSGSTLERLFYVADVVIDWDRGHDALQVNLGENTLTAFFPLKGDNRWRIVGTFPEGHQKDEGDILYDEIEEQVRVDTNIAFDITKVNWFSVYKVSSRAVSRFSKGRCFLAGDSAHIHTPAGAQGMNTGIQDGYDLAWKLAAVIKGSANAGLLATYSEERQPNARRLLKTTDAVFDFAASEDWFTAFVRKHIFPYVAHFAFSLDIVKKLVFPLVSQIGISYEDSSLSVAEGSFDVKAGERMPWFKIDGRSIYDLLAEPTFHLLLFSDEQAETAANDLYDIHHLPLSEDARRIFGTEEPFAVLLRPDNYIGWISGTFDDAEIARYLDRIGFSR